MISIIPSHNSLAQQAKILSQTWGINYAVSLSAISSDTFFLQLTPERLQLVPSDKNLCGPIYVDFISGQVDHRRHYGGGKGQTIAKAVGLNKMDNPLILDATAGMGKDAFIFASLGARVILLERSPVSAALLSDGLERALNNKNTVDIIKRMSLIFGDAHQLNQTIQLDDIPDVIYLDPMFPHRKQSALVKKEMLAFQQLIGGDTDSDDLLDICRKIAKKRVVVKRPIKAPYLNDSKPSYTMKMKKHRFDIYGCMSVM